MRIVLVLLLAMPMMGQVTFTTDVAVDDIGDSHGRVLWMTDNNAWKTVHWGTSPGKYTNIVIPSIRNSVMAWHGVYLSGLPSDTPIYARACAAPETATFTVDTGTGFLTASAGTWTDNTAVLVWQDTTSTANTANLLSGLSNGGLYYVRDASGLTFRLATTPGDFPIPISGTLASSSRVGYATCSAEFSFRTTAETSVQLPTAPAVPDLPVYPSTAASPPVSTCAEVLTQYEAWRNLTDGVAREIRIPPSLRCREMQTFGSRPANASWIVIRSDAADSALPPEGSRTGDNWLSSYATFVNDQLPTSSSVSGSAQVKGGAGSGDNCANGPGQLIGFTSAITPATGISIVAKCLSGATTFTTAVTASAQTVDGADLLIDTAEPHGCTTQHYGVLDLDGGTIYKGTGEGRKITIVDANTIRFHQMGAQSLTGSSVVACNNNLEQYGTYADAGSLPADGTTCSTEGELLAASTSDIRWCVRTDDLSGLVWRQFKTVNDSNSSTAALAPFDFAFGARNIRIGPGIKVTFNQVPTTLVSEWGAGGGQSQGRSSMLVRLANNVDNIILDRVEIKGVGYPSRHGALISPNGTNLAIVNSRVYGADHWFQPGTAASFEGTSNMIQSNWAHKFRIENNYISCSGICVFFPEGAQPQPGTATLNNNFTATPPTDILVRRNTFYRDLDLYMAGAKNKQVRRYESRHFFECKRCTNVALTGNTFDGAFSSVAQGPPFLFTPVSASIKSVPSYSIGSITSNVITFSGTAARALRGTNDQAQFGSYVTEGMMVAITGTTGTNSTDHNGRVVRLLDVDHSANPTTATIEGTALNGTSSEGTATFLGSDISTSDIDIRHNTVTRTNYVTSANGHNIVNLENVPEMPTRQSRRIRIHNNLIIAPNSRACVVGGSGEKTTPLAECSNSDYGYNSLVGVAAAGRSFNFWLANHGLAHSTITNNTVVDARGHDIQSMIEADRTSPQSGKNSWLKAENNLWLSMYDLYTSVPDRFVGYAFTAISGSSVEGTTNGLDGVWGAGRWSFRRNVFCCGNYTTQSTWYSGDASDNKWLSSNTITWERYARPNVTPMSGAERRTAWDSHVYRLRYNSPFKSGATGASAMNGTDGLDVGVDYDLLLREQGRVLNPRYLATSSNGATIAYTAPDSQACTVERSTSATWGTGLRTSDGGGNRFRSVVLSDLTPSTLYYARVLCAGSGDQHEITFRTRP